MPYRQSIVDELECITYPITPFHKITVGYDLELFHVMTF